MRQIPERFQAACYFCHDPIDVRKAGVFQFTSGWVKNRKGGGGNAIALADKHPQWSCPFCMEQRTAGAAKWQMNLFTS